MSLEEMRKSVRWFFETDVAEVLRNLDQHLVSDFTYHSGGKVQDREGYRQANAGMLEAFPDLKFDLTDVIVEGDRAVSHWTMRGTHQKEFNGIPATNKGVEVHGVSIDRFRRDKIAETWTYYNPLELLEQLGVGGPEG